MLAVATQLLRAGRPAEAIIPLREAAGWQPGNAAILHDLGLACLECGQVAEAIAALRGSVAANPRFADAHLRLGIALEAAGEAEPALAAYARAAAILPSLADARYRAGDLLEKLGRMPEAIAAYRRAAASAPRTSLGRIAAAKALLAENRDGEAEKILRQALALDKSNAVALELLGALLAESGRFEEARTALLRAVDNATRRVGNFYDIARCRPIGAEDSALVERMRASLALPGLEPMSRARLHLGIGKAAADLGDFEEAMRHFNAAHAIRQAVMPFDLPGFEARVDRLIEAFPARLFAGPQLGARPRLGACRDTPPVLIIGLPRSGTTLTEHILSAHPAVRAAGELPFWNERGRDWENAGALTPEPKLLEDASHAYLALLRGLSPGALRVTDKNPLNFLFAGLIHLAMPEATLIHCRRAPIDTALSIHQTHFNPRMQFPTGGTELVGYVRAYQRLMAHWRSVLPADRFFEIDYEHLTADPEPLIRRLVGACGLHWNEACLRPERNARVVKTASKWQARQPIYTRSAGLWRAYEPWLGPLRALLPDAPTDANETLTKN